VAAREESHSEAAGARSRSAPRLIADAFELYRRYPLLFLVLAAGVIVPYELIVLAATGAGPLTRSDASTVASFALSNADWLLIGSLVSALHVHAVSDVQRGEEPRLGSIARRGLAALPVVVATTVMSTLGFAGGLMLFVIPGVYFYLRWVVAAQTAAIEREGWTTALSRSWSLTEGSMRHVIVFLICVVALTTAPSLLLSRAFADQPTDAFNFVVGTTLHVLLWSFSALTTALLYYDLRTRRRLLAERWSPGDAPSPGAGNPPPENSRLDPRHYGDEDRPKGWYVDPTSPGRMRYWDAADPPAWHGTARTPRKLRRKWRSGADPGSAGAP
jgi:hypothetical protein